jgi:GT2 family glycosyltransferase
MFCCAMRRDLWHHIGPLDERFEVGMFEDTDYALRVSRAGYRILCAEGAFVHHFGQASIGKLLHNGTYHRLFKANRRRLELKWKQAWKPPMHRSPAPAVAR